MEKSIKTNSIILCCASTLLSTVFIAGTILPIFSYCYMKKYHAEMGTWEKVIKCILFIDLVISLYYNGRILWFIINIFL